MSREERDSLWPLNKEKRSALLGAGASSTSSTIGSSTRLTAQSVDREVLVANINKNILNAVH